MYTFSFNPLLLDPIYKMVSTKFKEYNVDSNQAINIIFVRNKNQILNPILKFKPLMTHQIFEEENVYGYHNLQIDIYYAAHSAVCFVDIYYDNMLNDNTKFSLEPDNIINHLQPWFPNNLLTDLDDFTKYVELDEPDHIYGECIDCFESKNENNAMTDFSIVNCDVTVPGFDEFHKRFQSLIIMFIDAANFIDLNDPGWRILYLYEACPINGRKKLCPVGFCTMYLFQSTLTTARISQFFIVPFLQKLGLGYKLLETTYNYLKGTVSNLEEIAVESPNKIFTRMRDNLDAARMLKEREYTKEKLMRGFSDAMLYIARLKYKLTNEQARKVYELLRYHWIQDDQQEFESFKKDVMRNRKSLRMVKNAKLKKSKHNACDRLVNNAESISEFTPEIDIILEDEFQKYVNDIQPSIRYLRRIIGSTINVNHSCSSSP